ncbi:hypothetical protein JW979_03510, partial [bacterium]|nr:hypothetical protein [candidate division CSSED10-310 bacterium]
MSKWVPALLIVTFICLFFAPALIPGNIFFHLDNAFQNIPFRYYMSSSLMDGRVPLWCPYAAAGFPIYAEGQAGVLYFLNWITIWLFPFSVAYNLNLLIHFAITGIGFYYMAKSLRMTAPAALFGAIGWMLSGYFIRRIMFVNFILVITWIPVLCWLWLKWIRTGNRKWQVIASLVIAIQIYAGHPQGTVISFVVLAFWMLWVPSTTKLYKRIWEGLFIVFGGVLIGMGQWLPTLRIMLQSERSSEYSFSGATQMSFPLAFFPSLFYPDPFGNAAKSSFFGAWQAYEWELSAYLSIVLISMIFFIPRNDRRAWVFKMMVLIGFILALGNATPLYALIGNVPLLNTMRIPSRWLVITTFGFCGLGALGLNRLIVAEESDRKDIVKRCRRYLIPFSSVLCVFIAIHVIRNYPTNMAAGDLIRFGNWLIILFAVVLLIMKAARRKLSIRTVSLLLVILFWDQWSADGRYPGIGPADMILSRPEKLQTLKTNIDSDYRIFSFLYENVMPGTFKIQKNWHQGWSTEDYGDYATYYQNYPMYSGMITNTDIITFNEISPLHSYYYSRVYKFGYHMNPSVLSYMSVKYVITPGRLTSPFP